MTGPRRYKCPKCGNDMVRIGSQDKTLGRNEKVWDLAHTGFGTTETSTTSAANYYGVSCPQEDPGGIDIFLVPYECPNCHYMESHRE